MLDILLVTTWDIPCGIAEHSAYLREAVEAADPDIRVSIETGLNPVHLSIDIAKVHPILHLNYHNALHSQWTPDWIRNFQAVGCKVLVTAHDSGVPNSDQVKAICAAADAFVVHEPYDDLAGNGRYWRQGVPGWADPMLYDQSLRSWCGPRPIVGTVGFPFPWKNYDLFCEASAAAGWACLLIAPGATLDQIARWTSLNPHAQVITAFLLREQVTSYLAGCDATAFLYGGCNTGTSGAIRQGIAARRPVLAFERCRQFRDLHEEGQAITWITDETAGGVASMLSLMSIERVDTGIVALAHRDSWEGLGRKYAALYKDLL